MMATEAEIKLALGQFRQVLANLYPDRRTILRVLSDAMIEHTRIDTEGPVQNIWHAVIDEALKVQAIGRLIDIVRQEYGNKPEVIQLEAVLPSDSLRVNSGPIGSLRNDPALKLRFSDTAKEVNFYLPPVQFIGKSEIADRLRQLKEAYPEPVPPVAAATERHPPASVRPLVAVAWSFLELGRVAMAINHDQRIRDFRADSERYFANLERYLNVSWSLVPIRITLRNESRDAAATDIKGSLWFPSACRIVRNVDCPLSPNPPALPSSSFRGGGSEVFDFSIYPARQHLPPSCGPLPRRPRYKPSPRIQHRDDGFTEVSISVKHVDPYQRIECELLWIQYTGVLPSKMLKVEYQLNSAELTTPQRGELSLSFQRYSPANTK